MKMRALLGCLFTGLLLGGCNSGAAPTPSSTATTPSGHGVTSGSAQKPTVAYVTNGIASFWVIAEKGAQKAGQEFDVNVTIRMPPEGVGDQKRMVEELLANGIDGIAISPIDPDNQTDMLKDVAKHTKLVTHDSDAPDSGRLCYIGMNNYDAGRLCGQLVKAAMPKGGSVMLFVGRLGQLNAKLRRQGVIDELLDREPDANRYDAPGAPQIGDKYTILDTRTDQFDFGRAKSLAQEALAQHPDLGCMVGLFAYNPPQIIEAVKEAGRAKKVQIVGFDEDRETLQGIIDGEVYGTVVQNPYQYGYKSVQVLAGLLKHDESLIPASKVIDIPARQITKDNVQQFWDELKQLTGDAK